MSYVRTVLQPGENVRYATSIHWIIYMPGLLLIVLAAAVYLKLPAIWEWLALVLLAAAAMMLFSAWFRQWTTEIAVTDRRIIFKRGFIRRRTIEMNLDKVESVDVDQSVAGRLFTYGDVLVRGVGVGIEPLTMVASPLIFRNHVTAE